jgi:signal transduction histidine kinase
MATTVPPHPLDLHDAHPLELIPFFQRWPCGPVRDLVYTFLFNTLLAAVFTVLAALWNRRHGIVELAWVNFVFAQCVGYAMHALYMLLQRLIPRSRWRSAWARVLFWGVLPIVGVTAGYSLAASLLGLSDFSRSMFTPRGLVTIAFLALIITGIVYAVLAPRARTAQAEAAVAREQARAAAAEREAALARMKALAAQVEPHFLYNTLAHVASLVDAKPADARAMLERLIALLRSSARAGNGGTTLGDEAEMLRAYLDLIAMRMGPRLAWSIDVPATLRTIAMPPSVLQPLVENAVKHGLEPKVDGGRIDLTARERDGVLEVVVADTGVGFGAAVEVLGGSTELGLAMLKQRLAALYGDAATLVLAENVPDGVRATLSIPVERR